MEDFKMWVLTGVVGVMGAIIAAIVSSAAKQAISRLDEMVKDIRQLTRSIDTHEQRIITLHDSHNAAQSRMNNHSERLKELEIEISILKNKNL